MPAWPHTMHLILPACQPHLCTSSLCLQVCLLSFHTRRARTPAHARGRACLHLHYAPCTCRCCCRLTCPLCACPATTCHAIQHTAHVCCAALGRRTLRLPTRMAFAVRVTHAQHTPLTSYTRCTNVGHQAFRTTQVCDVTLTCRVPAAHASSGLAPVHHRHPSIHLAAPQATRWRRLPLRAHCASRRVLAGAPLFGWTWPRPVWQIPAARTRAALRTAAYAATVADCLCEHPHLPYHDLIRLLDARLYLHLAAVRRILA